MSVRSSFQTQIRCGVASYQALHTHFQQAMMHREPADTTQRVAKCFPDADMEG